MRARLVQAATLGWRARGPMVLAVYGPPTTGKSTLAAARHHVVRADRTVEEIVSEVTAGVDRRWS